MPSARYFRLVAGDTKKSALEISAVHLYNDNTRVDQNATLSCGFGLNATQLEPVKTDSPVDGTKIDINLAATRLLSAYVVWTFATAVNVNAFKIGTGSGESTFLDSLTFQYSDDGITYTSFIKIVGDKKLYYPGPWQLTDLKPVGECYPAVMSMYDQYITNMSQGDASLVDNYTFNSARNLVTPKSFNWSASTTGYQANIPGVYTTGKFYFEVSCTYNNLYGVGRVYSKHMLGFFKDPIERLADIRTASIKGATFAINHTCAPNIDTPFNANTYREYSPTLLHKSFTPGVQHGLAIDLDTRTAKVVNPTYSDLAPGVYDMTNFTGPTNLTAGERLKLAIFLPTTYGSLLYNDGISVNFGQKPFVNPVPSGFQAGLGPRWREVPVPITGPDVPVVSYNRSGMDDPFANGEVRETLYTRLNTNLAFENFGGHFYIKGTITRDPNIQNKRFLARLFSHDTGEFLTSCVVSPSGLYEFYGIAYGLYSVFSVDLFNNTVSEAIGPVYPKEIV